MSSKERSPTTSEAWIGGPHIEVVAGRTSRCSLRLPPLKLRRGDRAELERWDRSLAAAMADHGVPISASQAWRICKSLDLKPWQVESWMTSHDPEFWEKASDVCGLYLDPLENAAPQFEPAKRL